MSGRSRTSHARPTSSMPFSSSASAMKSRSPRGRKPDRARKARVTAREAVSFFMSIAPRPQTYPSSSRCPAKGGCVQPAGSAGTTSVWPSRASDGPSPVPGMRAIRFARSGSRATSSHCTPLASRYSLSSVAAAVSHPGGFVVSTRMRSRRSAVVSSRRARSRVVSAMARAYDPAMADRETADRLAIRDLVENWAVWRDAGDWERFRTVWHDDGRMMATWFQGSADDFIRVSREGFERGVSILHFRGGSAVEVAGGRAIAQTKMTISQRASVDAVLCDVVCTGRFYDFLERRDGAWGLVLRQPIYEKDRLDPVHPGARLELDGALLEQFPAGYRHLAYAQTRIGFDVKRDMPGLTGPEV